MPFSIQRWPALPLVQLAEATVAETNITPDNIIALILKVFSRLENDDYSLSAKNSETVTVSQFEKTFLTF